MLTFTQLGFFNISALVLPTFVMMLLSASIFPMYIGECMVIFTELAASANACLFWLTWTMFSIFTVVATFLKAHSLLPITIAYIGVSIVSILFYYGLVRRMQSV